MTNKTRFFINDNCNPPSPLAPSLTILYQANVTKNMITKKYTIEYIKQACTECKQFEIDVQGRARLL